MLCIRSVVAHFAHVAAVIVEVQAVGSLLAAAFLVLVVAVVMLPSVFAVLTAHQAMAAVTKHPSSAAPVAEQQCPSGSVF